LNAQLEIAFRVIQSYGSPSDGERALHIDEYMNQSSSISLRINERAITRDKAARGKGACSVAVSIRTRNRRKRGSESDDSE